MTAWNSGTLTVDKAMPAEIVQQIHAAFDSDETIYVGDRYITFGDTPGDLLECLQKVSEILQQNGLSIEKDSAVEYYGDMEGYNVWTGAGFQSMDHGEFAVYSLTDEELIKKMKERGYCVCKEPDLCKSEK